MPCSLVKLTARGLVAQNKRRNDEEMEMYKQTLRDHVAVPDWRHGWMIVGFQIFTAICEQFSCLFLCFFDAEYKEEDFILFGENYRVRDMKMICITAIIITIA